MNPLKVWLDRARGGWTYRCDNHKGPLYVIGYESAAKAGDAARRHWQRQHVLIPPNPEETGRT